MRTSLLRIDTPLNPCSSFGRPGGRIVAQKMAGVGAPGSGLTPFGVFDPWGLTPESNEDLQLYREAELAHGRVAMVAALGFLVQESFHPIFADVGGPAIRQLDAVLQTEGGLTVGAIMLSAIFLTEISRAKKGWLEPEFSAEAMEPGAPVTIRTLRPDYSPGDLGFDPLGLKPKDLPGLKTMQTKEINNGRLAMIACAGIVGQELVTGQPLF